LKYHLKNATLLILTIAVIAMLAGCDQSPTNAESNVEIDTVLDAEAIVIGAGISGLSAAVEMGRAGVEVLVVDMNSVPGGHAVMAGGFAVVGSPLQEAAGYQDTPELAFNDWQEWTEVGDPYWSRFYAENSREMLYDWVMEMGVEWVRVAMGGFENSVPRFHFTERGALDVVQALVGTALELPTVHFLWNQKVEQLIVENQQVTGVQVRDVRGSDTKTLSSEHVVLATGGFEGNLDKVLSNWMPDLPKPGRLLIGASVHAQGQGLDLANEAGAQVANMDRQYIYTNGIVNIHDPDKVFAVTAGNSNAVWVDSNGKRFTNEGGLDKEVLHDMLNLETATYWAIFDEPGRQGFAMRGAEWVHNPSVGHPLMDNPEITSNAMTLTELAATTGLPADALKETIANYNAEIDSGEDSEFNRFPEMNDVPPRIEQAPYYALQFYPMTRKSMGGVVVDARGRALNDSGEVVAGLYAVGEVNGSVGINGKHGMDGMFLGPAVITGRVAGQTIAAAHANRDTSIAILPSIAEDAMPDSSTWTASLGTTELEALLTTSRDGYWHFETSHAMVLERQYECTQCHSGDMPFVPINNRTSKSAQIEVCTTCHGRR
jgi:predicted oxidoreductase